MKGDLLMHQVQNVVIHGSSSQSSLRRSQQTDEQKLIYKFEQMEVILKELGSILLEKFWKSSSTIQVSFMGINTAHPHHLCHFSPSVMLHSLLLSLLPKYFMLVLPYSHGQPTSSLHMSIRRSTSFLVQMFQLAKIIFKLL